MKPKNLLLPLAACIGAACLLISQSRGLSEVKGRTALLRQQIAAADGEEPTGDVPEPRSRSGPIHWKRIAELTGDQGGGIFARQEMLRAKARIREMSQDELLAALSEIKTLGLDVRSRGEIEGLLIDALAKKDPAAAMSYLLAPGNNQAGLSGSPSRVFREWCSRDMPGALAWFDGQIATGTFKITSMDGSNYSRSRIEAVLLAKLMLSDPKTASDRLSFYPMAERGSIFQDICASGKQADENERVARVLLARENLPANAQATVVSNSISNYARGGDYEGIDRFLRRIAATPEEREVSIAGAAFERFSGLYHEDKLTTDEIDNFRKWVGNQSPATVDEVTGRALAALAANRDNGPDPLAKANELLLHFEEIGDNPDDLLLGFLGSWPFWGDEAKARSLGGKIQDPVRREKFLKTLEPVPAAP